MVGFRIFDVGLLIMWLVWFFRLRDDDDSSEDDGPGGGGNGPGPGRGPGGWRNRGHRLPCHSGRIRGPERQPTPSPSRIRRPRPPVPAHRRG